MKKSTRNILICAALLLVLGGATAAIWLTMPAETEENSSESASENSVSSSEANELFSSDIADIESVSIKNAEDEYTLSTVAVTSENESSDSASTYTFTLAGYEDYSIDNALASSNAASVYSMTAAKTLQGETDLEKYGLSGDGELKVSIDYRDKDAREVVVGIESTGTPGRYVLYDGTVYIVSGIAGGLFSDKYSYFSTNVITVSDLPPVTAPDSSGNETATAQQDKLDYLNLSGTNFPEEISIEYLEKEFSSYSMTAPVSADMNPNVQEELFAALKTVTASGVAYVGEDADLEAFGLETPYAKAEYELNGEQHTLEVSTADADGNCFLIADGNSGVIYSISKSTVSVWCDATVMDYRSSLICLVNIVDTKRLVFEFDGKKQSFDVEIIESAESDSESSSSDTEYKITLEDGTQIDYENYQDLYQSVLSVAVLNTNRVDYTGEPRLRLTYEKRDGTSVVIEFYTIEGEDRCVALLDGKFTGIVRSTSVDSLLGNLEIVRGNQPLDG